MSSSESSDEWGEDESIDNFKLLDDLRRNTSKHERKPRHSRNARKRSKSKDSERPSFYSMVNTSTEKLMKKYSKWSGARTIVSQDNRNQWTPKKTDALRQMLQQFLTNDSVAMRPLVSGSSSITVSEPRVTDEYVRFTAEPFFSRIDMSLAREIDCEVKKYLPGFTFYIGTQGVNMHSQNIRLIPSNGKDPFSVTVPTEGMKPYFEFRPTHVKDQYFLLLVASLLLLLVLAVFFNFYSNYSTQGYSLWTGLHEVLVALRIF